MNRFKNNRLLTILVHCLVWAVLFWLPYLLSSGQAIELTRLAEHFWIPMVLYAALFYLNYFVLVGRFLFTKKAVVFFTINVVIIAFFVGLKFITRDYFFDPNDRGPGGMRGGPPMRFFIYIDSLSFTIPLIFSITLKIFERWIKTEAERKEAENARLESELRHLKYQLQPHFFFNSLNNIYSLVDISPEKSKETILALSKLMRYLLYESNTDKVSLKKEVEFMTKYIELMELRIADNTRVVTNFPDIPADVQVAPLLFIPLIENAFKHGVSAREGSQISFAMYINDKSIVFETSNLNRPKEESDRSGSGIGLQNTQKRLDLIYPGAYVFNYGAHETIFAARLEIEIRK